MHGILFYIFRFQHRFNPDNLVAEWHGYMLAFMLTCTEFNN